MLPLTVFAFTVASSRAGSSAVTDPFTVMSLTAPVSPKSLIAARTLPFTE